LTQGCIMGCPPSFMCRFKGTSSTIGECVKQDSQKPPFGAATVGHIHD
jgi:hypothetical protein